MIFKIIKMEDVKLHVNSPMTRKRALTPLTRKERIEIGRHVRTHVFKSCCFEVDKRVLKWVSQVILTLIVAGLCVIKLLTKESCEDTQPFIALLSILMGFWLPSPAGPHEE